MAKVKEIQVCGGRVVTGLLSACDEFITEIDRETDRPKLHFAIVLDDGSIKSITFRQIGGEVEVYGDFEGMPNFLDWSKRILGKE